MRRTLLAIIPLGALAVCGATVVHAQSTRDRLPPKQGTVRVAPAPRSTDRTPDRDGRDDHHDDRDRDGRDRHDGFGHRGGYGGYGYGIGYASGWIRTTGLQAILQSPQGQRIRFALNDQAYAAIFEIQPGRGVRLVFPDDWAAERALAAGWHEPPLPVNGDALAAMPGSSGNSGDVRWLYLVASDAPLGLVPQRRGVQALQALMGPMTFQSSSTYAVTDALRQRVLTLGPPGTWTDAIIAYRPGTEGTVGGAASVRCPNGVTYTLAAGERFECPR
jgi:hypothetical protein